ncbi:MAG: PKD domain-containing protein [Xanthomonadaceae bacterium]|nr:PKD domain-containing protein [Xanthomonadaceae bacterium]MDE2084269.1 PKD domain-containing protein [Xanthomonadaceae bacterium]
MTAVAATLLGLSGGAALASGNGNPYSPSYGHAYRHGAIPTRAVQKKMKVWEAAHPSGMAATSTNTLYYGGGTSSSSQGNVGVMNGITKVYLVFYGSGWGTQSTDSKGDAVFSGDPNGAAQAAQEMFKGIGTGNELWSADLTQWCQGIASGSASCPSGTPASSFVPYQAGGILAGVWEDTSATTPINATGAQMAQEAINAAAHFGNTTAASNRHAYYVIMSATGDDPDNYQSPTQGYCAWHDWNGDSSLSGGAVSSPYGDIAFSNQPYNIDQGSSCGVGFVNSPGTLDGWTMTLGHEWHEMVSDQFPAGGWTATSGQENSDECAWIAAGSAGGAANVVMGTGTFTEQASWSNDTNACAISHPIVSHGSTGGTPTASFTDTISGLTVSFTDTSTDSGGTISSWSWNFGDSSTSTAQNPSHTYAAGGTYTVSETVTDGVSGTTSSISHTVTVTAPGGTPTANFSFTTNGLTANFTDSSTDSGGTIGSHSWNFGDSSTSTATSPSHTYAAAGTYSVSETVTDSVSGKTSSKTASVTVTSGGGGGNVLQNGVAVTGLSATTGNQLNYTMVVPAGATGLSFAISGGTGDADLYVKFGSAPTLTSYDCRPYITGNNETCNIATAQAGTYYVMLNAYASFSGVSLVGKYTAGGGGGGGGGSQLLGNTGFETGSAAPWTMTSGVLCDSSCGESPHAGTYYAYLDGYGTTHTDTVSQSVTIPSGVSKGTLQFYLHIDTAETTTTSKNDTFTVTLGSTTVATFSNLNAASGYQVHSYTVNVTPGSSLKLTFTGKENASLQTSFVIDDVTFTVQ